MQSLLCVINLKKTRSSSKRSLLVLRSKRFANAVISSSWDFRTFHALENVSKYNHKINCGKQSRINIFQKTWNSANDEKNNFVRNPVFFPTTLRFNAWNVLKFLQFNIIQSWKIVTNGWNSSLAFALNFHRFVVELTLNASSVCSVLFHIHTFFFDLNKHSFSYWLESDADFS